MIDYILIAEILFVTAGIVALAYTIFSGWGIRGWREAHDNNKPKPDFHRAKGVIPWEPGDELPEHTIKRSRSDSMYWGDYVNGYGDGVMSKYSLLQPELFLDENKRKILEYVYKYKIITEYMCPIHGLFDLEVYFDYDEIVEMNMNDDLKCPRCLEEIVGTVN